VLDSAEAVAIVMATGSRAARCGAHYRWALPYPSSGRFSLCMNPDSHTAKTKRMAAKSIAAIPAESIPFIGEAVLIADTGYELYAACETVRDLDQLYSELGMAGETPDDVMHSVCDPKLPVSSRALFQKSMTSRPPGRTAMSSSFHSFWTY
jgi:hypothetical protein